jgi:hypothetical protein
MYRCEWCCAESASFYLLAFINILTHRALIGLLMLRYFVIFSPYTLNIKEVFKFKFS